MVNKYGEIFLLATKFYNSSNCAAILAFNKRKPEGKADVHMEGIDGNYQVITLFSLW